MTSHERIAGSTPQVFDPLLGATIWGAHVAGGMLTVQFGATRTVTKRSGREVAVGEHALHIQCPWRILKDKAVVVSEADYWWDETSDNSAELGNTVGELIDDVPRTFDLLRAHWHQLEIAIEGGVELHAFVFASSLNDPVEAFRLLCPGSDAAHVVLYSDGSYR